MNAWTLYILLAAGLFLLGIAIDKLMPDGK